eukprot:TRINITY_DN2393_c0_g1_i1.p1 TRINITY_DN2393_c0_g1~~TRINITY_DN2393_c0_g1_i1.p1  ORF type:complete len:591 (+),score=169.78 TRINITY_DN2393_c0_g1_i1:3-1775(+)
MSGVEIDWSSTIGLLKTTATLQCVVNPLYRRFTPVHDHIFQSLADLNAEYVRFAGWFPYPRLTVAQLHRPTATETFWDFSLIDPLMEDFMNATQGHAILSFSTEPNWLYQGNDNFSVPLDPNAVVWNYPSGTKLVDPTAHEVAEYYGRFAAYYMQGGFVDELGNKVESPYHYDVKHWEILNEVEGEHSHTPESYTLKYDAVVQGIRKHADPTHQIQFVGMALMNHHEWNWYEYFLNHSNHAEGIPLDWISYHFYGLPSSRTDIAQFASLFPAADGFVAEVKQIEEIRKRLSPETRTTIDEVGTILPGDNDRVSDEIPDIYWNAAGAMYAYLYGRLAPLGIDVLGQSQLVGYPALPALGLPDAQYPSVALLDWNTGKGNARYHVLKLLLESFKAGEYELVETKFPVSNPFCVSASENSALQLSCVNGGTIEKVLFASYGVNGRQCGEKASCSALNSQEIVEKACLGRGNCTVSASNDVFGDPCYDQVKSLSVQVQCSAGSGGGAASWDSLGYFIQGYASTKDSSKRKLLMVNKEMEAQEIDMTGIVGVAQSGVMRVVDGFTGWNPARREILTKIEAIKLNAYAVAVLELSN